MIPFSVRGAWLLAGGCVCIQMNDSERLLQSCVQDERQTRPEYRRPDDYLRYEPRHCVTGS